MAALALKKLLFFPLENRNRIFPELINNIFFQDPIEHTRLFNTQISIFPQNVIFLSGILH